MQNMDERVIPLVKNPSSVKNSTKITRSISKSDLIELNRRIDEDIKKNKKERIANEEVFDFFLLK